ncbi:hypothetical protein D3C81_1687190 [compost metagenome]
MELAAEHRPFARADAEVQLHAGGQLGAEMHLRRLEQGGGLVGVADPVVAEAVARYFQALVAVRRSQGPLLAATGLARGDFAQPQQTAVARLQEQPLGVGVGLPGR